MQSGRNGRRKSGIDYDTLGFCKIVRLNTRIIICSWSLRFRMIQLCAHWLGERKG